MTTIEDDQSDSVSWRAARWVAPFFALVAIVLVPWIVVLATRLPATHAAPHWNLTWAGFDVVLTLVLVGVAAAAWRRSPWLEGAAAAAAALLLVDAWFDVTTATPGIELAASVAEALLVELPIAILCLLLARDAERFPATSARHRAAAAYSIATSATPARDLRTTATTAWTRLPRSSSEPAEGATDSECAMWRDRPFFSSRR